MGGNVVIGSSKKRGGGNRRTENVMHEKQPQEKSTVSKGKKRQIKERNSPSGKEIPGVGEPEQKILS